MNSRSWTKRVFLAGKFLIAIGLVSYLILSKKLDLNILRSLCAHKNLPFVGIALFLLLINQYLVSFRLGYLLRSQHIQIKTKEAFIINYIGMFFNNYLPGSYGGDVMRAYYFTKHQRGKRAEGLGVLIFDRIIGLCAMSLIVVAGFFLSAMTFDQLSSFIDLKWLILISVVLVCLLGIMIIFLFGKNIISRIGGLFASLGTNSKFYRIFYATGLFVKTPRVVFYAIVISLVSHMVALAGMMVIASRIGDTWSCWKYFVALPLTIVLSSVPVSPGGIGWSEYIASVFWGIGAINMGAAVFISWRIISVLFSFPAGFVYLWFIKAIRATAIQPVIEEAS